MKKQIAIAAALVAVVGIAAGAWALKSRSAPVSLAALGSLASCERYSGLPEDFAAGSRSGLVKIAGGEFILGSNTGYADERSWGGKTTVSTFWIDQTEVTNAQFAAFVRATAYVTEAEKDGGAIFVDVTESEVQAKPLAWWRFAKGATWKTPEGPKSTIAGRENQPVILVTRNDAEAYARWLGRDLPTEAQWEYAAKAGQAINEVAAPHDQHGHPQANFWQGSFPFENTREDGFERLAPVGCYPANAFGLYDTIGNVWELTRDFYQGEHQPHGNGDPVFSLKAANRTLSEHDQIVIKGGSYLCAANFCVRYRASACHPHEANLPTSHVGFRTVLNKE